MICIQEARVKAYCSNPKAGVSSDDPRNRSRPQDKAPDLKTLPELSYFFSDSDHTCVYRNLTTAYELRYVPNL